MALPSSVRPRIGYLASPYGVPTTTSTTNPFDPANWFQPQTISNPYLAALSGVTVGRPNPADAVIIPGQGRFVTPSEPSTGGGLSFRIPSMEAATRNLGVNPYLENLLTSGQGIPGPTTILTPIRNGPLATPVGGPSAASAAQNQSAAMLPAWPPIAEAEAQSVYDFQQSLQADWQAQLNNALAVGADLAAASYDARLQVLGEEMARTQDMLTNVKGMWSTWRDQSIQIIGLNAEHARNAYLQYQQNMREGMDDYQARVKSSYDDYRNQVQSLIQQYITSTNETYGQLMGRIPEFWRPVVDAIARDDEQAIAAVRKGERIEVEGIGKAVAAASTTFRQVAATIGNSDPALEAELMSDLNDVAAIAVEQARYEGVWGERIQRAVGRLATKAARYQVASRLAEAERQRVEAVNAAEVTRYQALSQSAYSELGDITGIAQQRAQAEMDVEGAMYQAQQAYSQQQQEIMLAANEGMQQMEYELSEAIRGLQQDYYLTNVAREGELAQVAWDTYNDYMESNPAGMGQVEFAAAYMSDRLRAAIEAAGGEFDDIDWQRISQDVFNFWTGADAAGTGGVRVKTFDEFMAYIQTNRSQWDTQVEQMAVTLAQSTEDDGKYQRMLAATNLNLTNYNGSAYNPETKLFNGLNAEQSARLLRALETNAEQVLILNGETAPRGPSRHEQELYRIAFEAMNRGHNQWAVDAAIHGGGQSGLPLPGLTMDMVSNNFGEWRASNSNMQGHYHGGVDISAPTGTPITAMVAGTVNDVRYEPSAGGNVIEILGADGRYYMYMHMATAPFLQEGQSVAAGQQIGIVGSTGNSSGPHLHLSMTEVGSYTRVNPYPFLQSLYTTRGASANPGYTPVLLGGT